MPLADFKAAAPASLREGAAGAHALMCRRLAHEKHARGEALAQLEQLKSRRDALAAIAAARWGFLTGLQARPQAMFQIQWRGWTAAARGLPGRLRARRTHAEGSSGVGRAAAARWSCPAGLQARLAVWGVFVVGGRTKGHASAPGARRGGHASKAAHYLAQCAGCCVVAPDECWAADLALLRHLQDKLNEVAATAAPLHDKVGAPPPPARGAAPAPAVLALPPPLLNAHTLLAAAVRGHGINATVSASGMPSPACLRQEGGPLAPAGRFKSGMGRS